MSQSLVVSIGKKMTSAEAITLLIACKPLAAALVTNGPRHVLNEVELLNLDGFRKVYKSDYYDDMFVWKASDITEAEKRLLKAALWHNTDQLSAGITETIMQLAICKVVLNRFEKNPELQLEQNELITLREASVLSEEPHEVDELIFEAAGLLPNELITVRELISRYEQAA